MGGSVFTAGNQPLNTPRMPPEIYERVKAQCFAALREIYLCVASPIEGPAKKDHGDIDILVAWERSVFLGRKHSAYAPFTDKQEACKAMQKALGSPFIRIEKMTDHYAVHWPGDDDSLMEGKEASETASRRYIQIDVAICDTIERMQLKLFKHAHGDLWSILGTIIRPYGLTMDENAFWLRIVEIEKLNKNKAKVFLTNNPYEILSFLGLDTKDEIWNSPFDSLDDMYEYAATCRFFCSFPPSSPPSPIPSAAPKSPIPPKAPTSLLSSASPASVPPSTLVPSTSAPQTPPSSNKLNSRDKKRMESRPAYSKFLNEFLPRCRREGRYTERPNTVMSVREEAFQQFQGAKEIFEKQYNEFLAEKSREFIMAKLKDEWVPAADPTDPKQCQWRGCQVKALKKIIFDGDTSYDGITPEEPLSDRLGYLIESKVHRFVMKHKDAVGDIAFEQHQQAFAERKRKEKVEQQHKNDSQTIKKQKTADAGEGSNNPEAEGDQQ